MSFIFQMARRELRASWRRLLFFFLCIGIGVGAVVALRTVIRNVNRAMADEARQLMTADVVTVTSRPWSPETLGKIDRVARGPQVLARTETVEASTMARPADPSREGAQMVELKGVEPPFPFYGEFKLQDGQPFTHELLAGGGAVVAPLLLERLNLSVGDQLKIGESTFTIRGVVEQEPGSGSGFRLGPRVFVERKSVEEAGLTGFGSRAQRRILFKTTEEGMTELVKRLRAELGSSGLVNVRSYRESQENLNEQFERGENFLALVGLVVLVLGGVGVGGVTRVFVEQKKRSIAVLKCLGATGRQITAAYLAQTLALGVAGSLLGVALAKTGLLFVEQRFAASLPIGMSYELSAGAVLQGLGLGVLISLLFSTLPLMRVRLIKPGILLRDRDEEGGRRRIDVPRLLTGVVLVVALLLLSAWQAGSLLVGAYFLAGLAATSLLLYLAAWLLVFVVRRARRVGSFAFRQAIGGLHRPGNQTRVVVMAVGLGAFLVISVLQLQRNMLTELDIAGRIDLANMYLIDIQKDQAEGVARMIEEQTGVRPELVPTVRARIHAINGREVDLEQADMKRERGMLGREYVVTYRPNLEKNETIVAGEFWGPESSPEPEVSIEDGLRGTVGLDVGSTITFDILGRKLTARVTSARKVDWRNSRTGFLILFRPGSLDSAPQTYVGAINAPVEPRERARFQRAVLDKFPNVSVIDVFDVVRGVGRILSNITLGVTFIGAFVLLCGVLILVGSIAMTKYQRVYEAAVLKTLGAKRRVLLTILLAEYGLLGLVAGLIGAAAAVVLSYAVAKYLLKIPWEFSPTINLGGVVGTIALVTIVGALSSFDVLLRKPLATLRGQ